MVATRRARSVGGASADEDAEGAQKGDAESDTGHGGADEQQRGGRRLDPAHGHANAGQQRDRSPKHGGGGGRVANSSETGCPPP